ncbi:sensor protein ZraS [Thermodesulfomicrobium sp. WS]|uniref:ATP-binding protein n=1 Tax=Thermodesulfomicrobium sp. WS TaxID=3004129 RepID=UPI0024925277|nr:ATP-binding protein [Thermodesulfomicrobium sp. WS]BDV01616.1 sensor protein ZraS [Thermodesulfomicrobium sp. WS]
MEIFSDRMHRMAEQVAGVAWVVAMVLAVVVSALAVMHSGRMQETAAQVLMSQGDTLIRVLEAGARMGHGGGGLFGLGRVMDELVGRRDVEAVAVLDHNLRPMAVSARSRRVIEGLDFASLVPEPFPKFRILTDTDPVLFVVHRRFRPLPRALTQLPERSGCTDPGCGQWVAVVVLDARDYLEAGRHDRHARAVAVLTGGALVVLGAVSVFWRRRVRGLQEAMARQAQLALVGSLAAGVAHEIRNPLSSIKGFATYFAGLFAEDSREAAMARLVVHEVGRMDRSISELLDLARPFRLVRAKQEVATLCHDAARLVAPECASQGIAVEVRVPSGIIVFWDADRIRQALLNLLLNAIHAMPDGGSLTLSARGGREGVEILVEDTGHGIAPEHLERIFDPYFTTRGTGTGLGLAITRRIVEAHGGRIEVQSRLGVGTTVRLVIPAGSADMEDAQDG